MMIDEDSLRFCIEGLVQKHLRQSTSWPWRVKYQRDGMIVARLTPKDYQIPEVMAAAEAWLSAAGDEGGSLAERDQPGQAA